MDSRPAAFLEIIAYFICSPRGRRRRGKGTNSRERRMVSDSGWRKAQWAEDRSLTLGTHLGQAGDIQGQDIVWEPILASLFCLFVYAF